MRHRLDGATCYLSGPMDDVQDRGIPWRKDIARFLWDLDIGVLCPAFKPIMGSQHEDEAYFQEINSLKKRGKFKKAHKKMKSVAADDYRMVDKADFIILYIDKGAHMCGSYFEACVATLQRKPILVCCPQGKAAIPNWIVSVAKHEMFFDNWEDLKTYVLSVCYDKKVKTYNRWRFFDYDKIFGR